MSHTRSVSPLSRRTSDFQRLGLAFNELREAREWAEYNPKPHPKIKEGATTSLFTREETLILIALADQAVETLDRLDKDARLRLATRLVPRTRK